MTEAERRELLCLMRKDPVLSESIDELVLATKNRAVARRRELGHIGLLSSFPFSPAVAAEAIYKVALFLNRVKQEKPVHHEALDRWIRRRRQLQGGNYGQQTATQKKIL